MTEIDNIIQEISPYYKKKKAPSTQHKLVYNTPTEALEQFYFWILDFMNDIFGGKVEYNLSSFVCNSCKIFRSPDITVLPGPL